MLSAIPRQSKPGPRLEVLAGTRTVISCIREESPCLASRMPFVVTVPRTRLTNGMPAVDIGSASVATQVWAATRRCAKSISTYAVKGGEK